MSAKRLRAVRALLAQHAAAFMANDLHALAASYSLPCPARDAEGREIMLRMEADVVAPMAALREQCMARGLVGVSAQIVSIELTQHRRFRVWLRWDHHYPDHTETTPLDILYHLVFYFGTRLAIERAEYVLPAEGERRRAEGPGAA